MLFYSSSFLYLKFSLFLKIWCLFLGWMQECVNMLFCSRIWSCKSVHYWQITDAVRRVFCGGVNEFSEETIQFQICSHSWILSHLLCSNSGYCETRPPWIRALEEHPTGLSLFQIVSVPRPSAVLRISKILNPLIVLQQNHVSGNKNPVLPSKSHPTAVQPLPYPGIKRKCYVD